MSQEAKPKAGRGMNANMAQEHGQKASVKKFHDPRIGEDGILRDSVQLMFKDPKSHLQDLSKYFNAKNGYTTSVSPDGMTFNYEIDANRHRGDNVAKQIQAIKVSKSESKYAGPDFGGADVINSGGLEANNTREDGALARLLADAPK